MEIISVVAVWFFWIQNVKFLHMLRMKVVITLSYRLINFHLILMVYQTLWIVHHFALRQSRTLITMLCLKCSSLIYLPAWTELQNLNLLSWFPWSFAHVTIVVTMNTLHVQHSLHLLKAKHRHFHPCKMNN